MDIAYLFLLQDFRQSIHDYLTPYMEEISLFSVTYLIMIPVFLYWAIDKKIGLYTLYCVALYPLVMKIFHHVKEKKCLSVNAKRQQSDRRSY